MKILKKPAGFTMLELLLACSLVVVAMFTLAPFFWQCHYILQQGHKQVELHKSLSTSMDRLTREIMASEQLAFTNNQKGYQPAIDSKVLIFFSQGKQARYYVDDEQLRREFSGVGLPVASHIQSLHLEYFNRQGSKLVTADAASEVARVKITLVAEIDVDHRNSLSSSVTLRK